MSHIDPRIGSFGNVRHNDGHADRPACPNRERLVDYSLGKLPEDGLRRVARHIECCLGCETTLLDLDDSGDTWVSALRTLKDTAFDTRLDGEPAFRLLDERLKSLQLESIDVDDVAVGDGNGVALPWDAPQRIGRYRLLAKIGSGGMGHVYRARDDRLKRDVALKILHHHRCEDTEFVRRFSREMEAIGALDHRHIVRALDAGESYGSHFLVMEFIEGADLSQVVRQIGPLEVADACEVIRQAAIGLQYIQQMGLVHRDIKPSNLLLSAAGTVKILDLGLARLQANGATPEELTVSGQWVGTADYMAPEQADDARDADIRADIYSLGCTLYKLLAGRAPFSLPPIQHPVEKADGAQSGRDSADSVHPARYTEQACSTA